MKPYLILQNCNTELGGSVIDYFESRELPHKVVHTYSGEDIPELNEVESIINLGCPISMNNYHQHDFLKNLYQYVAGAVRVEKPYLGICFGGQMLAKILGARVEQNEKPEIGTYNVSLTKAGKSDKIFEGFDDPFPVFHWHSDTFKIPYGTEQLAEGDDCKNQAFRKGRMVGIQFHLEATGKEVPLWCDEYADELTKFGATKNKIVSEYENVFEKTKSMNYKMLDNFLNL